MYYLHRHYNESYQYGNCDGATDYTIEAGKTREEVARTMGVPIDELDRFLYERNEKLVWRD